MPDEWARWWLVLWAVNTVVLIALAFFVPVRVWATAVLVGFGVPEAIGLRRADRYPPLTYVLRAFLPRWFVHTAIFGLWGTVAAYWFAFPRPIAMGAMFALLGWLQDHFDDVFEN
jgi:hypothetical protein